MSENKRIKLFSGMAHRHFAEAVADYMRQPLSAAKISTFSDGEITVEILESVRGQDVFVLQSLSPPVNDHLLELLIMIDALKRSSVGSITAVLPYYAYARQDRQDAPRRPITAKLVADLLTAAGANRVMSMDLHAGQIQGFFSIPFEHLYASPVLVERIQRVIDDTESLVIVSPDAGGVERARYYCKKLSVPLAIIDKRREKPNVAEVLHLIGDVKGKTAVIIDDIIDTAGTITKAAQALVDHGAADVYACTTHPVLSGPAIDRISNSVLKKVFVCDTIPLAEHARACPQIEVCSVSAIVGEAIQRVHVETSVSSLFG